jgi:hypothetical protein
MTAIQLTRRTLFAGLFLAPLAIGSTGCTPNALGFLFRGDGKKPPTYPLKPLKNRDTKEVRVVAFATMAPGLSYEFASVDRDVSQQMSKKLAEGTKEEKHPVKIIRPEDVERFKLSNPTWKVMHPSRVAQQLNADYLIDISITGIGLYQPGSGNVVYEGWATADVTVYETGVETPVYQYFHQSKQRPQAADGMPAGQYKAFLIKQFSYELASRHMKHTEDSRVAPFEQR